MTGPNDANGGPKQSASPRGGDALSYLCDIIVELKHLSDMSGQRTLSAILEAALTEARIQNDGGRR